MLALVLNVWGGQYVPERNITSTHTYRAWNYISVSLLHHLHCFQNIDTSTFCFDSLNFIVNHTHESSTRFTLTEIKSMKNTPYTHMVSIGRRCKPHWA